MNIFNLSGHRCAMTVSRAHLAKAAPGAFACVFALLALTTAAVQAAPGQAAPDLAAGQRSFAVCASCHQIGGTAGAAFGPQLTGIVGRPAGSTRDFAYSPAMKASKIVWTEQNLAAFLRDPGKVVPGTKMRFWGLSDEQQIANLIAYMKSVK
ncbi:MAG: c-type cytochrome [Massilia sp.]